MTWKELEDASYDYALQTGYCEKKCMEYYELQIALDFLKVFENIQKSKFSDLLVFNMKRRKYNKYNMFSAWYREHIYDTVEHEIAGVLMKSAILIKQSKLNLDFTSDMELNDVFARLTVTANFGECLDLVVHNTLKRIFTGVDTVMHILKGISGIIHLLGIDNIEGYIRYRLEYSYLKK